MIDNPSGTRDTLFPNPNWAELVTRIQANDPTAMEEFYCVFTRGMRYYLFRHTGLQDLEDRIHDCFLIITKAIRRGELREPERVVGFARTVVRRHIAGHIDSAITNRRRQVDLDATESLPGKSLNPEAAAIARQRQELAVSVLKAISRRSREVLTRFYLEEQSQERICQDMSLTETQFRLLKSRAKARFGQLGKQLLSGHKVSG